MGCAQRGMTTTPSAYRRRSDISTRSTREQRTQLRDHAFGFPVVGYFQSYPGLS